MVDSMIDNCGNCGLSSERNSTVICDASKITAHDNNAATPTATSGGTLAPAATFSHGPGGPRCSKKVDGANRFTAHDQSALGAT
eukprot:8882558-Alexandrium_andersonii.AAC.1